MAEAKGALCCDSLALFFCLLAFSCTARLLFCYRETVFSSSSYFALMNHCSTSVSFEHVRCARWAGADRRSHKIEVIESAYKEGVPAVKPNVRIGYARARKSDQERFLTVSKFSRFEYQDIQALVNGPDGIQSNGCALTDVGLYHAGT